MTDIDPADVDRLVELLARTRGVDLSAYKRATVTRRLQRRLDARAQPTVSAYLDLLEVDPGEVRALLDAVLINVTAFFRDEEAWRFLVDEVLPDLVERAAAGDPVRVWSAGCSTGEEAYTLAIVLAEALGEEALAAQVKIFATDVDEAALAVARAGVYPAEAVADLPAELVDRYFERLGDQVSFRPDLRPCLIFGRHDLLRDPPISRLDLLVCRNTLMYFNAEAQAGVLARFRFALGDHGVLFLGRAELLSSRTNDFSLVALEHRIFRAVGSGAVPTVAGGRGEPTPGREVEAWDQLGAADFLAHPVAHVVVDGAGRLALANTAARRLFSIGAGDLGRPLRELPVSFRPLDLLPRLEQVRAEGRPLAVAAVLHDANGNGPRWYDVVFTPLGSVAGAVSLTWLDTTAVARLQADVEQASQDREAAFEELQSTNEELETTNEELQSANEELETINEELQSTNEELQSINLRLRRSSVDRDRAVAFLESVLANLHQAVVAVDADQVVTAWNERARELWGLPASEALGRTLAELDCGLPAGALAPTVEASLTGLADTTEVEVAGVDRRGRQVTLRATVSAMPDPGTDRFGAVLLVEELGP